MVDSKFEKLKNKYRVISCFNDDLTKADGSLMVFASDFKTIIYPLDKKHCCLITWKNSTFLNELLNTIKVDSVDIDTKEKTVVFEDKYFDQVCEMVDIKKANKTSINPLHVSNVPYYLRIMRNVSDTYKDKLKEYNSLKKKVKPTLDEGSFIGMEIDGQRILQVNPNKSVWVMLKNKQRKLLTIAESTKLIAKYI